MDNNFNEGFVLGEVGKDEIPTPFFGEEILDAYSLEFDQLPKKKFVVYRFKLNPRHDPVANTLTETTMLWQVMDKVHGVPLLIPSLVGLVPYTQILTREKAIETALNLFEEFEVATTDNLEAIFKAFFIIRNNYDQYLKKTARKAEAAGRDKI